MEVICGHCKTKLKVPDDKIPRDHAVRVNCPKCRDTIIIDARKGVSGATALNDPFYETGGLHREVTGSRKNDGSETKEFDYGDYLLDFFDEGVKLTLALADDAMGENIKAAVEDLGYKYLRAANTVDALGKLRFHHFDIILIADGFDGQKLDVETPVMNYINHIPMSFRRRIFLGLIGDGFKTGDDMMAYAMSADVVINTGETDRLSAILKKGLSEHEKFYKVFMDTLVEVGKA